jgi:hypothetical protein
LERMQHHMAVHRLCGVAARLDWEGLVLVGWDRCPAGSVLREGNRFRRYLVQNLAVPGTWESLSPVSDWSLNPPTPCGTPSEGVALQAVERKVVRNQLERWQRPSVRVSQAGHML